MNIFNFNFDEINLIQESCDLGIKQYDDEEIREEGIKILNEISKQRSNLLISNKQKNVIASFLANWYNENEKDLTELQNKMLEVNYDKILLTELQPQIKKLNTFINLIKIFNKSLYKSFFVGTGANYRKNIFKTSI